METLLISLHPRHSQNIFSEKKTIELRKKSPRMQPNGDRVFSNQPACDRVLIYETVPTGEIVGWFLASSVMSMSKVAWHEYTSQLCLTESEIDGYLNEIGYGIVVWRPQRITPIPLSKMRELNIVPPQGYRYLNEEMIEKLGIKFND